MTCFAKHSPDDEFEYRTRILASSDLPLTKNAKKQTQDAGPLLIYIIVDCRSGGDAPLAAASK